MCKKNLAEEDRRQKALKKEKKAVKKWKWTTDHTEQSFRKEMQQPGLLNKGMDLAATPAHEDGGFFIFPSKVDRIDKIQLISMT